MTDMIERVAKAINDAMLQHGDYKPDELARAAIAAMREPTNEQYEALSATGKMWRELDSRTVWQTYIDAALEEN
jgi:hypothetical protein